MIIEWIKTFLLQSVKYIQFFYTCMHEENMCVCVCVYKPVISGEVRASDWVGYAAASSSTSSAVVVHCFLAGGGPAHTNTHTHTHTHVIPVVRFDLIVYVPITPHWNVL